jgi:hypothetical protein
MTKSGWLRDIAIPMDGRDISVNGAACLGYGALFCVGYVVDAVPFISEGLIRGFGPATITLVCARDGVGCHPEAVVSLLTHGLFVPLFGAVLIVYGVIDGIKHRRAGGARDRRQQSTETGG